MTPRPPAPIPFDPSSPAPDTPAQAALATTSREPSGQRQKATQLLAPIIHTMAATWARKTRCAGGRRGYNRSRKDGAQMLLLSGVVFTLGFVIMGTTLVQLHGLEGSTERTQRDSLMDTVDNLINGLNQTIRDSIKIGETNTTSFKATLHNAEANLRDNAVRSGVYASVQLSLVPIQDPEMLDLFWRDSRCIGYNPAASEDGIIVGWEADNFEETIAGAVYDIHVTDGRQSFRSLVYIKIVDCAEIQITSTHTTMGTRFGIIDDPGAMRKQDGLSTNFTEELDLDTLVEVLVHPTINQTSIQVLRWNNPDHLLELNGDFTNMPSRLSSLPSTNWFRFQIDPPEHMEPGDTMPNITLELTGYKNLAWSFLHPQDMYLRVYPNQNALDSLLPAIDQKVDLPVGGPSDSATQQIVLDELNSGTGNWSYTDIVESRWVLTVFGAHQPSQNWYVDHFNMTGSMVMAQGHRLDVEIDWQNIPNQYTNHELHMRYRIDPATEDEGFLLMVRDTEDPASGWTEIHNMTDTTSEADGWHTFSYPQFGDPPLPNRPEFRIVDTIITDNWIPEDVDTLQIDYFYIESCLSDYCP